MEKPLTLESLVTFRLGHQVYALPIGSIVQIVEVVDITPIPQVNHAVEGVINYHGQAIPAVNLRRLLGLPAIPLGLDMHIIVASGSGRTIGLLVDEVLSVRELSSTQIACPDQILPEGLGEVPFLSGVARAAPGLIFVLDLDRLLEGQPTQQLQEAMDALAQVAAETVPEDVEPSLEIEG